MTDEIPTEALQAAARDTIYAAAGLAMVRADDDDEEDSYFEWHECIDQPACNTVQTGGPCPCAGMPWPSAVVQAGVEAAIAAAAPFLIAEGRRQGPVGVEIDGRVWPDLPVSNGLWSLGVLLREAGWKPPDYVQVLQAELDQLRADRDAAQGRIASLNAELREINRLYVASVQGLREQLDAAVAEGTDHG